MQGDKLKEATLTPIIVLPAASWGGLRALTPSSTSPLRRPVSIHPQTCRARMDRFAIRTGASPHGKA